MSFKKGNIPWNVKGYNKSRFAYFAGLFDGDGYVGIVGNKHNNKIYKQIVVSFGMTDKQAVEEGCQYFGGTLKFYKKEGIRQDIWQWRMSGGIQIEFFLRNIKKHLRIKQERVEIALEYRKHINFAKGKSLNEEEILIRKNLENKLKELNKRGK